MESTINFDALEDSRNVDPVSIRSLLDTREMTSATEWDSIRDPTVVAREEKEADFFQASEFMEAIIGRLIC